MGAPKLNEHDSLRAAHVKAIEALRELANARDEQGLPSMGLDNMRREVITMMARAANDNQPGET